jgi:hypothetical protein
MSPRRRSSTKSFKAHLSSFVADARAHSDDGAGLPWFVERELREYLRCGILAHGFARVPPGDQA